MKYKVGDRVKVKTWEAMEKKFGVNGYGHINTRVTFLPDMEKKIPNNRIVTIQSITNYGIYFFIECDNYGFSEDCIEGLAEPEIKRGDLVWASDDNNSWTDAPIIFLAYIEGAEYAYICVRRLYEQEFKEGKEFKTTHHKYAKPYIPEKKTVTLELTDEQLEKIKEIIKE